MKTTRPVYQAKVVLILLASLLFASMYADSCAGSFSGLYFSTTGLPVGYSNTFYEARIVVSGGILPYTFVVYSGALPPGLYLDPYSGRIYGIPTMVGTYRFVCRVRDARFPPYWVDRTFVITISSL